MTNSPLQEMTVDAMERHTHYNHFCHRGLSRHVISVTGAQSTSKKQPQNRSELQPPGCCMRRPEIKGPSGPGRSKHTQQQPRKRLSSRVNFMSLGGPCDITWLL